MDTTTLFTRRNLAALVVTLGLLAATWSGVPSAYAAPERDEVAHAQLCADLYLIYDGNMDIYYDHSRSQQERQQAYENAQKALSDFRKQGCKYAGARVQQVLTSSSNDIKVHDVALGGAIDRPFVSAGTAPRVTQLVTGR